MSSDGNNRAADHGRRDAPRATFLDFLNAARPRQWIKNIIVLAPFLFAFGDKRQVVSPLMLLNAMSAILLFSITASGVYVFNDIFDVRLDRLHPVKRHRPIASGRISPSSAWSMALICVGCGLAGSWLLLPAFGIAVSIYVAIQAAYTLKLKHVPLLDVFVIAFGFVVRAVGGGLIVRADISSWFLVCTFLIALFLALCKRRHEKRMIEESGLENTRPSLIGGDIKLFDQLIAIVAGATIVAYALYTQWPDTVQKFGTAGLIFTIPFVIFGLFRYLDLVYRGAKCDQPEYILLTDKPLLVDIILFGLCVLWIAVL